VLEIGVQAPDFELSAVTGERRHKVRLADFRGKKNVVLAFYPLDWTSTGAEQITAYNRELGKFAALDAQVLGITVDSTWGHIAWQEKVIGTVNYPLLSDFYPHGETAQMYGVLRTGNPVSGINESAVFVIDKDGKIVFAHRYELGGSPEHRDVLEVLERLAHKDSQPANR
jgi:peroxiredoxin